MERIILIHFLPLLNSHLFAYGSLWQQLMADTHTGLILKIPSCMVIFKRSCNGATTWVCCSGENRKVCHLHKSLCGIKQNPHALFGKFSQAIEDFDMSKSKLNHSIFYKRSSARSILLIVSVDDIVIAKSDTVESCL